MAFYADDLAHVHDTGFADLACGAAPFLVDLLSARGIRGGMIVDLGCGSGLILKALLNAGHSAVGVDISSSMLAMARTQAPRAELIEASLYDTELPACDAIFAVGEPLNYVTSGAPALPPFFKRVARALKPGGLFVFDVIVDRPGPNLTRRGFHSGDTWACLVDTHENPSRTRLTRDVTTFVKAGATYRRDREVHRVRVLKTSALKKALEGAGFTVQVRTRYGEHPLAVRRRAFINTRR